MSLVNVIVRARRGTLAQWTATNRVLQDGELGVVATAGSDPEYMKVGDGVTPFLELPYLVGPDSSENDTPPDVGIIDLGSTGGDIGSYVIPNGSIGYIDIGTGQMLALGDGEMTLIEIINEDPQTRLFPSYSALPAPNESGGAPMVTLSQSAYDALVEPVANTFYIVEED